MDSKGAAASNSAKYHDPTLIVPCFVPFMDMQDIDPRPVKEDSIGEQRRFF
jgi:hypothetical protein